MQMITTLTSKGQATIPKTIRDYLGIKSADKLSFAIDTDGVRIRRVGSVKSLAGALSGRVTKPISQVQMDKAIQQGHLQRYLKGRARSM